VKIKKIEPLPNVLKFKNKEDFSNRIVQQVLNICKDSTLFSSSNKKILELKKHESDLINKDEKLNELLEKSKSLKNNLTNKIQELNENNIKIKSKLLSILNNGKEETNENH